MNALDLVTITVVPQNRVREQIGINFIGWPTQRDLLKAIELEVRRVQAEAEVEASNLDVPVSDILRPGQFEPYGLATQIVQTCPVEQYVLSAPIAVYFAEVQIGVIRTHSHVIYQP